MELDVGELGEGFDTQITTKLPDVSHMNITDVSPHIHTLRERFITYHARTCIGVECSPRYEPLIQHHITFGVLALEFIVSTVELHKTSLT